MCTRSKKRSPGTELSIELVSRGADPRLHQHVAACVLQGGDRRQLKQAPLRLLVQIDAPVVVELPVGLGDQPIELGVAESAKFSMPPVLNSGNQFSGSG